MAETGRSGATMGSLGARAEMYAVRAESSETVLCSECTQELDPWLVGLPVDTSGLVTH